MHWLRYRKPLLVHVSFQASQFGGSGYINVTLTVSEVPIERQRMGDWDALNRTRELIPSGQRIDDLLKRELTDQDASVLKAALAEELVPILEQLADPAQAFDIVTKDDWLTRNNFLERLKPYAEAISVG